MTHNSTVVVKDIGSSSITGDVARWLPSDPLKFAVNFEFSVGLSGELSSSYFSVVVTTPLYIRERLDIVDNLSIGDSFILLGCYDFDQLFGHLKDSVAKFDGFLFDDVVRQLRKEFYWEHEGEIRVRRGDVPKVTSVSMAHRYGRSVSYYGNNFVSPDEVDFNIVISVIHPETGNTVKGRVRVLTAESLLVEERGSFVLAHSPGICVVSCFDMEEIRRAIDLAVHSCAAFDFDEFKYEFSRRFLIDC